MVKLLLTTGMDMIRSFNVPYCNVPRCKVPYSRKQA